MVRFLPLGTVVNVLTVIVGSLIGVFLQEVFSENIKSIVFQAIGLATLLIGIQMSLKVPPGYLLILIFSLILGGMLGEWISLDQMLDQMGNRVKTWLQFEDATFSEGLITAFLIFCVGSVTIIGAIVEGIKGKSELILIISLLDGVTSIALASSYGIGVLFSIFPMFIFQGGLTMLAKSAEPLFTDRMIDMISATGGLLILGLGLRLLKIGNINIENLLPALLVAILATWLKKKFFEVKSDKLG